MRGYMMKGLKKCMLLLTALVLFSLAAAGSVSASDDDNSLYDMGITTPGAVMEPEFSYDIWEYQVRVPQGTTVLELDPVPSSSSASIVSIEGTELSEDGTTTVYVNVESGSGLPHTYTLYVTADGAPVEDAPETEMETEPLLQSAPPAVPETQPETEDDRYVKVDKNTIQEAEETITTLKGEITRYRDTVSLYTKIMYALIALAVIMLFLVINLLLKRRDLKRELDDYRSYGYAEEAAARSSRSSRTAAGSMPDYGAGAASSQHQAYQSAQPSGQLDVVPQTSGRKRKLPSYEDAGAGMPGADPAGMQVEPVEDRQAAKAAEKARKQAERAAAQAAKASQREAEKAAKAARRAEAAAAAKASAGARNAASSAAATTDVPPQAPAAAPQGEAPAADAPVAGGRKNDVEINMIDL